MTEPARRLQDHGVKGGVAALLSRERRAHPRDASRQARAWTRLEESLGIGPQGPDGGGGISAAPAASSSTTPESSSAMSGATKALAKLAIAACLLGASGAVWGVATKTELPRSPGVQAEPFPARELAHTIGSAAAVPAVSAAATPVEALPSAPPRAGAGGAR
ncbi:MAG: hypothetical protein K0S65_4761, partial [Labilithrix sp.]|nr:hypothetical protein [Labilithrix sp.]